MSLPNPMEIRSNYYYFETWKTRKSTFIISTDQPAPSNTKLLLNGLKSEVDFDELIPYHQRGFRQQHSTSEQTHRIVNIIETTLEEKKICTGVFLDVEKALDKVWHQGLLYKIKKCFSDHYYWLFTF